MLLFDLVPLFPSERFEPWLLALKLLRGSHILRKQHCIEKILVGVGAAEPDEQAAAAAVPQHIGHLRVLQAPVVAAVYPRQAVVGLLVLHLTTALMISIVFLSKEKLIYSSDDIGRDNQTFYINILHFEVYTFFCVGYGSIYPVGEAGMVFTMVLLLYGLLPFSYLLEKFKLPDEVNLGFSRSLMIKQQIFDTWLSNVQMRSRSTQSHQIFRTLRHHYFYFALCDTSESYNKAYYWELWPAAQRLIFDEPLAPIVATFSSFFKSVDQDSWRSVLFSMKFRS